MYLCDKRLDGGTRQCNEPASLYYASSATGDTAARCKEHEVIPYKPELGELLVLTVEEYAQRERASSRGTVASRRVQGLVHERNRRSDSAGRPSQGVRTFVMRVCDAALLVLRETKNPAVMWGDSGLLHQIAQRANIYMKMRSWMTETAVLNALSKQPGELVAGSTLSHSGGRQRRVRIFWLPECVPKQIVD